MVRNYLKIALRNLWRDKSYMVINIFGLAIGIGATLLIGLYIIDELSYDKFHEKSERIYRIYVDGKFGNTEFRGIYTANPTKEALLNEFSQVEEATHFFKRSQLKIEHDENSFIEDPVFFVDSSFLKVFTFPVVRGDSEGLFSEPDHAVLTESAAKKYFGNEDPVGKMIKVQGDDLYQVKAVCKDVPDNSHFHFDILLSYLNTTRSNDMMWINSNVYTYFVVKKGVDPYEFEEQLDLLVEKYVGPQVVEWMGIDLEEFANKGNSYGFFIQPLEKIYLNSDFNDEIEPVSDISRIWYFSVIALFVLIIACINFMNLATAKYANRAKEVGIRKVAGSKRRQLIQQFLSESVLVTFFAVILAIVLVELLLPGFNNIAQKNIELDYFNNWYLVPGLIIFTMLVGFVAGTYPAFYLSSFSPAGILKGEIHRGVKGARMRGILVTGQFVVTIVLFISTYIIYQQNQYMTNKKLGFDKEKVVVVDRAYYLDNSLKSFIEEITKSPDIHSASVSSCLPGRDYNGSTMQVEGRSSEDMVFFAINFVRENYQDALGLKLLEGRFFSEDYSDNANSIVINEKAVEELGFDNPIGKYLKLGNDKFIIIGIVENFHYESLHKNIRPLGLRYSGYKHYSYMPVRLNTSELNQSISFIKDKWEKFASPQPFSYFFLDDDFDKLYNAEKRTAKVFSIFSILAILIACMGLFGLSAFMAEKRTKEIGIRKTLGAKPINILRILFREIFVLLIISTIIAWPIAYYVMSQWLGNFAYRIELNFLPFVIASVLALLIAIFTTSFQALKAAHTNPAYILRDE